MIKRIYSIIVLVICFSHSGAQLPYTQSNYTYDSLLNVVYGVATDYAGNTDTLTLDLYKPKGDNNCLRPIMVLVHGGDWIGGSKEDGDLVYMSREFARKGWVVANINYRLGTHKATSYQMYALCNNTISQPCSYICDSSEIYRANFRAMQDAKGVIRFMKSRNGIDSSDINNVFIAGESAGGFVSLAAAFTDSTNEKPADCFSIAAAPNPDASLIPYGCIPALNSLLRPDLGDIEGDLHLGFYNSKVKGVGNFYGGVLDLNLLHQYSDTPVVYLFHQGSDIIVHYNYGPLLGRISWECYAQTNLCQSYYFYPGGYGSEGIRQYFVSLGSASPVYQAEIVSNYSYLNNCLSNGHSIDNIQLRMQNMTDFFADKISASGNNPAGNCLSFGIENMLDNSAFTIYPNPSEDVIILHSTENILDEQIKIFDAVGHCVFEDSFSGHIKNLNVKGLSDGVYFINVNGGNTVNLRFIKR
jgi:dienelactone hydrolase